MRDLIEALQILLKYANDDRYPTCCEHGELYVYAGIGIDSVSADDIKRLEELGFFWYDVNYCFMSLKFGSC